MLCSVTCGKIEDYFFELSEIVSSLENNSPLLKEEYQKVQEQLANQMIADSAKGLKININLTGQSIHEDRPDQSFYHHYRTFSSIYARKPLFHWGALDAKSKIAYNRANLSKLSFDEVVADLSSQSRHAYLDLLILRKKIEMRKEQLYLNQNSLRSVARKQKVGITTKLQVNESNATLLENKILLADLNQSLSNSLYHFKSMTGWNGHLTFLDTDNSFEELLLSKDFALEIPPLITGISSSTMKRIQREIDIEENNLIIADSKLKPKLNLVGGIYQDQIALANSEENLLRNNALVGLEATWSIWDSSESKGEKQASLARKRKLEYAVDRELKTFRLHVSNLRQNLISLSKRIKISRELLKVAQARFQTSQIERNANRISANKHLESKIALGQAKINQLDSVCEYLKTHDLYLKATQQNHE